MRRTTLTKQRLHLISRQVCAVALIALFVFAPNPPASSMAQSEDPEYKKPAPTPPLAIQGGSLSLRPKIIYREKAKYTVEAHDNITHGVVALNVVFRSDGSISDIKVVKGLPYGLTERAIDAARKVRFEPAIKNGQPVHVRGDLEFAFHLYDLDEKSIHKMLRNDFPVLSKEAVQVMAKLIYKRGERDSDKAWHFAQQCLENGVSKLPQSEQEELTSLTLEAVSVLDESDQRIYQKLMERSKTGQAPAYNEMWISEYRFRGISRLPDEKRRRAEALYNKASTLGTELP
jgi:TonB family protein